MPGSAITLATTPHLALPEIGLALDPHAPVPFSFVSHAHADHFARHDRILCSPVTAHLLHRRFRVARDRLLALDYDTPREESGHLLRLLPAGHIFGSAMLHVTRLRDRATLLYTGDFKLRESLTSEAARLVQADTLVMETTFGLPNYVFPSRQKTESAIIHFVRSVLDDGDVPILLGYSLGKAQEAIALLQRHNIPVLAHKNVHEMTQASIEAGLAMELPPLLESPVLTGHVLVAPPNAVRSTVIRSIKNRRVAMLSGWALSPGARYRYQTDEAFPLSDHADYPELLETVQRVRPRRVVTIHGFTREFAATLRHHGFEAWSVQGGDQIELPLARQPAPMAGATSRKAATHPDGEVARLTRLIEEISLASSRLRKITLLSDFLRELPPEALRLASAFISGRLLPDGRPLTLGSAVIRQALLEATRVPLNRYREISNATADIARTSRLLLEQAPVYKPDPSPPTLVEWQGIFERLASLPGALAKTTALAGLFVRFHPRDAELLVRLLTGDLRAGLKSALLEDAIAEAFDAEPAEVRRAHMVTGDLAATAIKAREGTLAQARLLPHTPIAPMLASPEPDAGSLFERLSKTEDVIHLEPKFDGIRAQLHVTDDRVSLFSRDLRSLAGEFPELIEAARSSFQNECVLDGELIAFAEGRQLNFFDLQKRLGRKRHQGDLFLGEAVPVRFVAFDVLWRDGEDLLDAACARRRQELEAIAMKEPFQIIGRMSATTTVEIEARFKESLSQGHEGLIAKAAGSVYSPGRRGKSWLKLKGVMPTLDCVVIAAQQGHGKRADVLSDYTFAVRDQESGALMTLGKAYSGLTDEEIEELTEHFRRTTIEMKRRVHQVEPTIVLEIAFDSINPSKRHDSGLALRFPRIKAIRRDKTPADIDSLQTARAMVR